MSRSRPLLAALAALTTLMAAGCGGGGHPASETTPHPTATDPPLEVTTAPAPDADRPPVLSPSPNPTRLAASGMSLISRGVPS